MTSSPSYDGADLVVVNTCGFIDAAVQESLDAIGEALAENGKVIVTGCLGAKGDDRARGASQGARGHRPACARRGDGRRCTRTLPKPHDPFVDLVPPGGVKLTPRHYAYLKISEGCNHRCTFCIIPSMRGDLVSRPIGEVMREAEALVGAGVKELLVISQDTSAYGVDVKYRPGFWSGRPLKTRMTELAGALGEPRRLGAAALCVSLPQRRRRDSADGRRHHPALSGYSVPACQPAHPQTDEAPRRGREDARAHPVLARCRCPDLTLRSTFIVGFPGETDAEFEELLAFLKEAQLDRVGCFKYSPVEGAAANALPDAVPEELKEERLERFMEVQAEISAARLDAKIGREIEVIVDEEDEVGTLARSHADAPEIDGVVYLEGVFDLQPGTRLKVRVDEADEHDLWATPV